MAEIEQTSSDLLSLFSSPDTDLLVRNNGDQVPVSELEGKTVGLFFSTATSRPFFAKKLVTIYNKLKETQHDFEVISVSLDIEEEAFKDVFINMPWLAIPFNYNFSAELGRYFKVTYLPTLVILGPDGKTLHPNMVKAIEQHGIRAYPFTREKFLELQENNNRVDAQILKSHILSPRASPYTPEWTLEIEAIKEARLKAQTLESLLVFDFLDFVIGKDGAEVAVSTLVGKNILLYFSACRAYLPKLIEVYHEIKSKDENFEVIFISWDDDQSSFDELFSTMPWLALPFDDKRIFSLNWTFHVSEIPMVVSLESTGQTVTLTARDLIKKYGANAYPFTQERIRNINAEYREMAKSWPEKVKSNLHQHELFLSSINLHSCDKCCEHIYVWSFRCGNCDFDLHPNCVLEEEKGGNDEMENGGNTKEG